MFRRDTNSTERSAAGAGAQRLSRAEFGEDAREQITVTLEHDTPARLGQHFSLQCKNNRNASVRLIDPNSPVILPSGTKIVVTGSRTLIYASQNLRISGVLLEFPEDERAIRFEAPLECVLGRGSSVQLGALPNQTPTPPQIVLSA